MSCAACPCLACAKEPSWPCPLFDGRDICETCCFWESEVTEFAKRLGKTVSEVRAVCAACGKNAEVRDPANWTEVYRRPVEDGT